MNLAKNSGLVVVATGNAGKAKEFAEAFADLDIRFQTQKDVGFAGDVDESGKTFRENAFLKAHAIAEFLKAKKIQAAVIADDSGLEVEALGGAPGIYSARYAGGHGDSLANCQKLLQNLKGERNRSARFVATLCVIDENGKVDYVEGECRGTIIDDFRGTEGFGYDPLFVPEGETRTFAEMSLAEKRGMSHRGRAIAKLKEMK